MPSEPVTRHSILEVALHGMKSFSWETDFTFGKQISTIERDDLITGLVLGINMPVGRIFEGIILAFLNLDGGLEEFLGKIPALIFEW